MKLALPLLLFTQWILTAGNLPGKTLNILLLANASTQDVIQRLIQEYHQQNPQTDFNVSIVQSGSITAKLNTLVTAGQPPDVVEITTAFIQNYAAQALDLSKYTDGQELLHRYLSSYRPFITSGNKVLGVPIEATANGLFYNKKLFEKAGIQVPRNENEIWTWDQFRQAVATVMRLPECRMGVSYDCTVQRWSNLLYQANGKWISTDGKSFLPDRAAAEQALAFFRSLVEAKLVPTSAWPGKTDAGQLFKTGVAAMMWSGNWQLKSLIDGGTAFPFGTTYFPRGAIRATCPGGEFFFGFASSPNKDEAARFLLWWAKPETTLHYLESLGGSLLSPMSDLKVNYGKYAEYLVPMLSDLSATPDWVSIDLARPALNLLQNDLLTELILSATGREQPSQTILNLDKLGTEVLQRSSPSNQP
jgi:alpha-1,4-digalacturonate transport system substrate-binding protein